MKLKTLLLGAAALCAVAASTVALPVAASAKDVTITLNDEQQRALVNILDVAVKAGGLSVTQNVWYFYSTLLAAVNPPVATAAPADVDKPQDAGEKPKEEPPAADAAPK